MLEKAAALGAGITFVVGGAALMFTPAVPVGVVALGGGALISITALIPSVRDIRVQPPSFVRRKALALQRARPDPYVVDKEWLPEIEEFRRRADDFWEAIREEFGRYGTLGHPTEASGLGRRVVAAAWPDEAIPDDESWVGRDGQTLTESASAFFLKDFVRRCYRGGTTPLFDKDRRELAILAGRWQQRAEGSPAGFSPWLASQLRPAHVGTVKLLWYVEIAKADSIPGSEPDFAEYVFLRDLLTGGA